MKTSSAEDAQSLLTAKEVAEWLRIRRQSVYKLVAEGMPVLLLGPRQLRFSREDIDAWMRARAVVKIDGGHSTDLPVYGEVKRPLAHRPSVSEVQAQIRAMAQQTGRE